MLIAGKSIKQEIAEVWPCLCSGGPSSNFDDENGSVSLLLQEQI